VKDGGLGVRRVSSLALPAFLASAASTLPLHGDILADCACSDNDSLQSYLSDWSSAFDTLPDSPAAKFQEPGSQLQQIHRGLHNQHPRKYYDCLSHFLRGS